MTKLDPSVYKKRNDLLRRSKTLQSILLDSDLQFYRYYKLKMDQDKYYKKWLFYDKLIKLLNKKDTK